MQPSDVVLYVASKLETIPGRTALQKLCYFVNVKASAQIPFKAHYYGPYSPEIARATDRLLGFDLVAEKRESGSLSSPWRTTSGVEITDWERRSYSITDGGRTYWAKLASDPKEKLSVADDLIAKLAKSTKLDAKKLAGLAKVHYLMQQHRLKHTDIAGIVAAAREEGWSMTEGRVERALKTLDSLPL